MSEQQKQFRACRSNFALYFLAVWLLFFLGGSDFGDDLIFKSAISEGFFHYLSWMYHTYTSRVIVNGTMMLVLQNDLVWTVLTAAMFLLAIYSIFYLLKLRTDPKLLMMLMACYSMSVFYEAGWCATAMNTIWPVSLGLYALRPIRDAAEHRTVRPPVLLSYALAACFACNEEQMCAIVFCTYLLFDLLFLYRKMLTPAMIVITVLAALSIVFILTCPGLANRAVLELDWGRYPQYARFDMAHKAALGVVNTTSVLLLHVSPSFFVFCLLLPYAVRKQKLPIRCISLLPITFLLSFNILRLDIERMLPLLQFISESLYSFTTECDITLNAELITVLLIAVLLFGSIFLCTYCALEARPRRYLALLILLAGVTSRFIMAFSPTVIASGDRTAIYMQVSLIMAAAMMIDEHLQPEQRDLAFLFLFPPAVLNFLNAFTLVRF